VATRSSGYRSQRLQKRRSRRLKSWQSVVLYALAAGVAFSAVLGAVYLSKYFIDRKDAPKNPNYLALVTVGAGESKRLPVAGVLVHDEPTATVTFFTIPRSYLFTGAGGEYVMGEDVIASSDASAYIERLADVPVDYVLNLSYADLAALTGGSDLYVRLSRPVTVGPEGSSRTFEGDFSLSRDDVAEVLSLSGGSGPDEALLEQAVLGAAFEAAALQPAQQRAQVLDDLARRAQDVSAADARKVLDDLVGGRLGVERLPSRGVVSLGQFAYRPDPEQVLARITRLSPSYDAPYTVLVENGSGKAGIGQLVAERLAVLDVALPPVRNAASFDYGETQILAGAEAAGVAQDVRAILGLGVVLNGRGLPKNMIVVIVGRDLKEKDLQ
jgi:hypothetical protein